MLGVVINHLIMQGGVLHASTDSGKTAIIWLVEIVAYLSVDCYILISGYVNYSDTYKGYKFNRIVDLWFQVVFWGIFLYLPSFLGLHNTCQVSDFVKTIFPITFNTYWFFTAYFALWFVMPALNSLCSKVKVGQAKEIVVVMLIVFSGYATLTSPVGDVFGLSGGFSFLWFCMLYVIGALIRKYKIFVYKTGKLLTVMTVGIAITWFCVCFLGKVTKLIFGKEIGELLLVSYNSPTILLASICLVAWFSKMELRKGKKLIRYWSSATFGVYIIHMHPWIKNYILLNNFTFINNASAWLIPIELVGCGLLITVICLVLDKGREYLFKMLKIDGIEKKINNVLNVGINLLGKIKIDENK